MALSPKQLRLVFAQLRAKGLLKYIKRGRRIKYTISQTTPEALKAGPSLRQVMSESRAKALISRLPLGHQKSVSIALHAADVNIPRPKGLYPGIEVIGSYAKSKNLINLRGGSRAYMTSIGYTLRPSHVPKGRVGTKSFEIRNGQLGSAKAFYHEYGHAVNPGGVYSSKGDWAKLLPKEWSGVTPFDPVTRVSKKQFLNSDEAWSEAYAQYFSTKASRNKLKLYRPESYAYMDKLSKATLVEKVAEAPKPAVTHVEKPKKLTADQAAEAFAHRIEGTSPAPLAIKKVRKVVQKAKDQKVKTIEADTKAIDIAKEAEDKVEAARKASVLAKRLESAQKRKATLARKAKEKLDKAQELIAKEKADELKKAADLELEKNIRRTPAWKAAQEKEAERVAGRLAQESEERAKQAAAEASRLKREADELVAREAEAARLAREESAALTAAHTEVERVLRESGVVAPNTKINKKVLAALIASGGLTAAIVAYLKLRKKRLGKKTARREEREPIELAPFDVAEFEHVLREDAKKWQRLSRRQR